MGLLHHATKLIGRCGPGWFGLCVLDCCACPGQTRVRERRLIEDYRRSSQHHIWGSIVFVLRQSKHTSPFPFPWVNRVIEKQVALDVGLQS